MQLRSLIKSIVLREELENGSYFEYKPVSATDYMKYYSIQLIYTYYLIKMYSNSQSTTPMLHSYKNALLNHLTMNNTLNYISSSNPYADKLMSTKYEYSKLRTKEEFISQSGNTLRDINIWLSIDFTNNVIGYKGIEKDFYIPFLHTFFPSDSTTYLTDGKFYNNAQLLCPSLETHINPITNEQEVLIVMDKMCFNTFIYPTTIQTQPVHLSCYDYLQRFDFSGVTISQIIAILSNFAFEYNQHDMSNYHSSNTVIPNICKDIMIGNNAQNKSILDFNEFIEFLRYLNANYRVGIDNERFLGKLLSYSKTINDIDLINYLSKPIIEATVAEMESFRNSVFFNFKYINIGVGLESADAEDTNTDDDQLELPSEDTTTDQIQNENSDTDHGIVPEETDNDLDNISEFKIELAGDETLEDNLLRNKILHSIEDILNSEDSRYSQDELMLLREWKSKWINLVSIQTIRQFFKFFKTINIDKLFN